VIRNPGASFVIPDSDPESGASFVIPVKTGIQSSALDPGFRRDDSRLWIPAPGLTPSGAGSPRRDDSRLWIPAPD